MALKCLINSINLVKYLRIFLVKSFIVSANYAKRPLAQVLLPQLPKHLLLTTTAPLVFCVLVQFKFNICSLYGVLGLQKAFKAEYVVQDDAREYVFWMQRFVDAELLPHDLIADYFQSITPFGYAAFTI
jgi:hypothetical protein